MNKMLLAVFDNEAAAFEGLKALKDLHESGDITLYSWAVVARDKAGKIELNNRLTVVPSAPRSGCSLGA